MKAPDIALEVRSLDNGWFWVCASDGRSFGPFPTKQFAQRAVVVIRVAIGGADPLDLLQIFRWISEALEADQPD